MYVCMYVCIKSCFSLSLRYSFASSWPVGFDQQFLWSVSVAFPHPRTFPVLETMTRSCERVCEDIVTAIDQPLEDIDFDAILQPYYGSTIHYSSNNYKDADGDGDVMHEKSAALEVMNGEEMVAGDDGVVNRRNGGSGSSSSSSESPRVETVVVKIPEPKYYEEFRAMHEREFADLQSAATNTNCNSIS